MCSATASIIPENAFHTSPPWPVGRSKKFWLMPMQNRTRSGAVLVSLTNGLLDWNGVVR